MKKELFLYFESILLFITFGPYFTWNSALATCAFLVFSSLLVPYCNKNKLNNQNLWIISILLIIKILLDIYFSSSVIPIVGFFLLILLYTESDYQLKILNRFKSLISFLLLISLIVYTLVVFVGIDLPHTTISPLNRTKEYLYNNYYLLVVPTNVKDIQLIYRFHAFFEEPGNVSIIVTTFLLMDHFKLSSWKNIVLFISGIVSFSMFFYIIMLLFYMFNYQRLLNKKFILSLTCIILGLFVFINSYQTDIDLAQLLTDRLSFKDGHLAADNRSSFAFDNAFENLLGSYDLLWGKGISAHMKVAPEIQTYKMMIYDYGLVYVIISLSPLLFYGIVSCQRDYKVLMQYLAYILLFYYQRPAFLYMPGLFYMLLCMPIILKKNRIRNK